jgi:HEPN domain-containing protein
MAESRSLEALSVFAEAAQDLVAAGLEQALGRNFACADACNQVAEKALQAVSIYQTGHRTVYDHNLRSLGERLNAPETVLDALEFLTPYHPETFHAHTSPEEADDVISADDVAQCMASAKTVLNWVRGIVVIDVPGRA